MGTKSTFAFVAALAFAGLLSTSAETPPNTIVFEFSQVGADVVLTVDGELTAPLASAEGAMPYCDAPRSSFASSTNIFFLCVGDSSDNLDSFQLTNNFLDDSLILADFLEDGDLTLSTSPGAFMINFASEPPVATLFATSGETTFSATGTFSNKNLDDFFTGGSGLLASFTIDGHATSGTVEIRVPESEEVIVGDPHFFVGRSLYDWKQVGVYDHLVFADHAVMLDVKEFAGCDGEMSGEFILGLSVSGTSWTAACDGIYDAATGELVANHRFTLSTPCVTATVLLTNGYLNLYNITTSCKVEGGVHKAMTDHASSNVDGWWEWTEAGGFELKNKAVPKLTPLVKKPRVISIDI